MPETPVFTSAAVAAPHWAAAETGRNILAEGGNAIEAMVAMASVIAVVYPHMNAIGGDNFWLVREKGGKVHCLEGCGRAGSLATIDRYRALGHGFVPARGPLAANTVPGAVGGWSLALQLAKHLGGRLPLAHLLADAIRNAREGYPISASEARYTIREIEDVLAMPAFRQEFLNAQGKIEKGTNRKHLRLADTLDRLAHSGLSDFYEGDIAREMAADFERFDLPITRADLERQEPRAVAPLSLALPGCTVYASQPPTQGVITLMLLGMMEELKAGQPGSADHTHALIEAIKRAYLHRNATIADPDTMPIEAASLLDPAFLKREASAINMKRANPSPLMLENGDTIWMGAIDGDGLAVSLIQSVFWDYGSGVVLPRTGVLMQNRGMAFSLDPKSHRALAPGRRPFHTLNPGLASFADGRVLSYGTMGGDAQPQILTQNFTKIRAGMPLADAIDHPRFLYGLASDAPEGGIRVEGRFDGNVLDQLAARGHAIEIDEPYLDKYGHSGALMKFPKGQVEATHDPRADGGALGL
jgi:oxamate amidohydrolase